MIFFKVKTGVKKAWPHKGTGKIYSRTVLRIFVRKKLFLKEKTPERKLYFGFL